MNRFVNTAIATLAIAAAGALDQSPASGFWGGQACDQAAVCDDGVCQGACDGLGVCDGPCGCDVTSCDSLGDGCCGACGCDRGLCGCLADMKLLGLLRPSERCFDDFISPMINFVHFEDPRTLTEIRPIFLNHNVPDALGGGAIQLYAMQFRVALTERLSLIGVKDGFIVDDTGGALDTLLDDGWAAVTAGLKYNLVRDVEAGTLASVGATYEIPIGSTRALQRVGDGEFHVFATAGQRLLEGNAHLLSALGYRFAANDGAQPDSIHWSNQFDVRVTDRVYLLTGVSWWHWTDEAVAGLPLGVAGQDLFDLPSTNVEGNNLVTQNVGLKYKPTRNVETGIAFEFPLTEFRDVIDNRLQLEMILRY